MYKLFAVHRPVVFAVVAGQRLRSKVYTVLRELEQWGLREAHLLSRISLVVLGQLCQEFAVDNRTGWLRVSHLQVGHLPKGKFGVCRRRRAQAKVERRQLGQSWPCIASCKTLTST